MDVTSSVRWLTFLIPLLQQASALLDTLTDDTPLSNDSEKVAEEIKDLAQQILAKVATL